MTLGPNFFEIVLKKGKSNEKQQNNFYFLILISKPKQKLKWSRICPLDVFQKIFQGSVNQPVNVFHNAHDTDL